MQDNGFSLKIPADLRGALSRGVIPVSAIILINNGNGISCTAIEAEITGAEFDSHVGYGDGGYNMFEPYSYRSLDVTTRMTGYVHHIKYLKGEAKDDEQPRFIR